MKKETYEEIEREALLAALDVWRSRYSDLSRRFDDVCAEHASLREECNLARGS